MSQQLPVGYFLWWKTLTFFIRVFVSDYLYSYIVSQVSTLLCYSEGRSLGNIILWGNAHM